MVKRLMNSTKEELQIKVIVTLIGVIVGIFFPAVIALVAYMWAWIAVKKMAKVASFSAFIALILGKGLIILLFMVLAFVLLGYFLGLLYGLIGCIRYIFLLLNNKSEKRVTTEGTQTTKFSEDEEMNNSNFLSNFE